MTPDEEAAALCGIAYSALLCLPRDMRARFAMQVAIVHIRDEIARLRKADPESIQNEFERRAAS